MNQEGLDPTASNSSNQDRCMERVPQHDDLKDLIVAHRPSPEEAENYLRFLNRFPSLRSFLLPPYTADEELKHHYLSLRTDSFPSPWKESHTDDAETDPKIIEALVKFQSEFDQSDLDCGEFVPELVVARARELYSILASGAVSADEGPLDVTYSNQDTYTGHVRARDGAMHGLNGVFRYGTSGTQLYEGDFASGFRHGNGCFTWHTKTSSSNYHGEWCAGLRHGKGTYTLPSGVYEGNFVWDRIEGQGMYRVVLLGGAQHAVPLDPNVSPARSNGDYYTGEWRNGIPHGKGTVLCRVQHQSPPSVYRVLWPKNFEYSHGFEVSESGRSRWECTYDGEWKSGMFHGDGVWRICRPADVSKNEKVTVIEQYSGEWRSGQRTGSGAHAIYAATGEKGLESTVCAQPVAEYLYEGSWKEGLPWGHGTCTTHSFVYASCDPDERIPSILEKRCYTGEFSSGQPHGHGSLYITIPDTRDLTATSPGMCTFLCYEGEWRSGTRNGHGVCYSQNGQATYKGDWHHDLQHGRGIGILSSNKPQGCVNGKESLLAVYDGMWSLGLPDGRGLHGTLLWPSLRLVTVYEILYNKGVLLRKVEVTGAVTSDVCSLHQHVESLFQWKDSCKQDKRRVLTLHGQYPEKTSILQSGTPLDVLSGLLPTVSEEVRSILYRHGVSTAAKLHALTPQDVAQLNLPLGTQKSLYQAIRSAFPSDNEPDALMPEA